MKRRWFRRRGGSDRVGPFFLFAHMRSGSSTLARALDLHPAIRILHEPFNSNFAEHNPGAPDYLTLATDPRSIDELVDGMFRDHNGVKTLGYQIPWELSAHLLRNPERKVVFLKRLNMLQVVVSGLISQQTGVWHAWDLSGSRDEAYADLKPLDVEFIRGGVADVKEELEYFDAVLATRTAPTFVLSYDDLYRGSDDRRRSRLASVFEFLGASDPPLGSAETLLDPRRTRLNSAETYALIPNAREIDDAVGSDDTGWLFER